jgi:hypothetical protein
MVRGGNNYDNKLCLQCDPFPSLAPSFVASAHVFPSPPKVGLFHSPNNKLGPLKLTSVSTRPTPSPAQHMANVTEHLCTPWCVEDAQRALKRESAFRAASRACGVLRPFMLLVSMSTAARVRIGAMMGISLISSHSFGDAHAEAWVLLHSPFIGMQWNRGDGQTGSSGTWYDILRAIQDCTQQESTIPLNKAASLSLTQCADDALAELELAILVSLHLTSLQNLSKGVAERVAVLKVVSEVIQTSGVDAIQSSVTQAGLPRVILNAIAILAAPRDSSGDQHHSLVDKLEIIALFHASVMHALERNGMDVSTLALEGMAADATDAYCKEILSSGQYTLFQDLWQEYCSGEVAAQGSAVLGAFIGGPLAVVGVAWLAIQHHFPEFNPLYNHFRYVRHILSVNVGQSWHQLIPVVSSLIEHRVLLAAHSIDIGDADAGSIADAVKKPKRALLSNGLWIAYDDNAAFAQGVPIQQQQQLPPDAPCVFYFHGLMSSRLERHPTAGAFGVRIITVDRPGQGMSDHCHYTYEEFSGFICELADIIGIKKFGVVGFSSGGPYALALAYVICSFLSDC